MKRVFFIVAIVTGLTACTASEKKDMASFDAMEAKARAYCSATKGLEIGSKEYRSCNEHYMQGMKDQKAAM